jgi:hypothetical protein
MVTRKSLNYFLFLILLQLNVLVRILDDLHSHHTVVACAQKDLDGLLVVDRGNVDSVYFEDFVTCCKKPGLHCSSV